MRSLWRAMAVDPSYYLFWGTAVLAYTVLTVRELRAIRRAVERRP